METVLGVSMAPTMVRMVLVEGRNADGPTIDQDNIDITSDGEIPVGTAPQRVIAAILGTREGAAEGGYQLASTGVTWIDPADAAVLREELGARKIENVMLVSAFLAAAALAHAVGSATDYDRTALLFIEPDTATLAVVNTADGSVSDVCRRSLPDDDDEAVAELADMVEDAERIEPAPGGIFVVGADVDVAMIKPALQEATSLPVSVPEEPETALARGAALASANAPLFASSTAALAYAQDPGTGEVSPFLLAGYLAVPGGAAAPEDGDLAYSALPDGDADIFTAEGPDAYGPVAGEEDFTTGMYPDFAAEPGEPSARTPFLTAMGVLTIFVVGVVALVLSLAITIRPHIDQKPSLSQNVVTPAQPAAPPPLPKAQVPAPPAPAPAPAHVPAPVAAPRPAPAVAPALPPPPAVPPPPPALPLPAPALPLPAPALPPPPIPPLLPQIFAPPPPGPPVAPWGGDHGGGGWGHGRGRGGFGGPMIPLPVPGFHLRF
ncbi:hypothetical protein MBOT_09450 [Mycobacterium botniense]|uniref:DUF7159 domain-containing protein n=1 Tax=Mycobacterium botniense TaxID=84962 RepID=A0A7I9XV70_9MYCO|nr:hypothetical protein MBOT_09450 [Mycobacterium botniense]